MRVAMIGSGYVGLVSGACLAELGHSVVCVDRDAGRIERLRRGKIPIYEPGLESLVGRNVAERRLAFATDLEAALRGVDVVFIAVGTPPRRGDGHADLSSVWAAARSVAATLDGPAVLVTKSTVPIGTGDGIEAVLRELRPGLDVPVVSNPEFLREGSAIGDFLRPDRVVVGSDDAHGHQVMRALYAPLLHRGARLFETGRRNAELLKYAANAFLAVKISFINEISDLCERVGANVLDVSRGIGMDERIGPRFLEPGPGYGGSCFPKDTLALARTAHDHGMSLRLVEAVIAFNEARRPAMARKVLEACGGALRDRRVAVLGLAFKAGTDDIRESPAIAVIEAIQRAGGRVRAHDPAAMPHAADCLQDVEFAATAEECLGGAHVAVLVTDWEEYRRLPAARLRQLLRDPPLVVDLRNALDARELRRHGIRHVGMGMPEERLTAPQELAAKAPVPVRHASAPLAAAMASPER
ncbi:UDP-glucose dehydrogenase family protein [Roseicella aerolata]|uniref:UDP-glucose 6-dehydrogenase n=1 Tax=Roseicella aerolata TaxID=2883479 RepID=A0A9X1II81_9PROT|nr:UDP-glucose/GDP-mannose dehydrogenase family protein [Roseicella aerolata]MCB4825117.1 UDP-glucose/GDP-mannose dehydrogenase family protein [Roseicella aerolata]